MELYSSDMIYWWNHVDKTFSHIKYDRWLGSTKALIKQWKSRWLFRFPKNVKHVAEYGIVGGLLGELLINEYNVVNYTGIDISDRQISEASKRLKSCCTNKFTLIRVDALTSNNLYGVDTFISQAVIQHFPSDLYTQNFLGILNHGTELRWVMLQTRYGNKRNQGKEVARAQFTNTSYLKRQLSNYQLTWQSKIYPNGYVFHVFEKVF
jgi:cyclopropane fatty-acyl-phospholipid synthase-like methyltransferase